MKDKIKEIWKLINTVFSPSWIERFKAAIRKIVRDNVGHTNEYDIVESFNNYFVEKGKHFQETIISSKSIGIYTRDIPKLDSVIELTGMEGGSYGGNTISQK